MPFVPLPFVSKAMSPASIADSPSEIMTRFGSLPYRPEQYIWLPKGIPAFSHLTDFAFFSFCEPEQLKRLHLLQSLKDANVGFILSPLVVAENLIADDDLVSAVRIANIKPQNAFFYLIVTIRPQHSTRVSTQPATVNLRAPLVVDHHNHKAMQVILNNESYSLRYPFGISPD